MALWQVQGRCLVTGVSAPLCIYVFIRQPANCMPTVSAVCLLRFINVSFCGQALACPKHLQSARPLPAGESQKRASPESARRERNSATERCRPHATRGHPRCCLSVLQGRWWDGA